MNEQTCSFCGKPLQSDIETYGPHHFPVCSECNFEAIDAGINPEELPWQEYLKTLDEAEE